MGQGGKFHRFGEVIVAGFSFRGLFSFILTGKLRSLKCDVKRWNKEAFSKVVVNKKERP